jgi:putative two-component system response regulator
MVQSLLSLVESRHGETGLHSRRTQALTKLLAQALATEPGYRAALTPDRVELLAALAPLHDIGKVSMPDHLLNKPGPFTDEERAQMKLHPARGRDVIERAEAEVGIRDDVILQLAKEIVYTHHERWDGTGYPEGVRGADIPVAGRIMAIVDVYDATANRINAYNRAYSHEESLALIVAGSGTQFDPVAVEAFRRVASAFKAASQVHTEST